MSQTELRLLLVEDNTGDAILFRRALRRENGEIEVVHVASGEAALEILSNADERFDLAFLDLNLPGISGNEVLRSLKSHVWLRSLPVVVLSSSQAQSDIDVSYRDLANLYMVKPVDPDGYEKLARFVADCWFGTVALPTPPSPVSVA